MMRRFPEIVVKIREILKICNAFANGSSANKGFSKIQLPNMIQLG